MVRCFLHFLCLVLEDTFTLRRVSCIKDFHTVSPQRSPLLVALALFGCSGGNSGAEKESNGGPAQVAAVEVSDNGGTATMTVHFELSDGGQPLAGVAANDIRFTVAKLIPPSSPSSWQSYINRVNGSATQATYERASTTGGVFTDNGDGTYSYKFSFISGRSQLRWQ